MDEMSTKFQLTADNYYSDEANRIYLSVSQFKDFVRSWILGVAREPQSLS